jgi:hypothetical protein
MSQVFNNPKITDSPIEHIMNIKGSASKPNPIPMTTVKGWKMRIDTMRPRTAVKEMLFKKPIMRGRITTPVTRISAIIKISVISLRREKFSMQYL